MHAVATLRLREPDSALATGVGDAIAVAIRRTLEAVGRGLDGTLEDGMVLEADLFGACFGTRGMKEGTSAFLEKRPPKFTGQ